MNYGDVVSRRELRWRRVTSVHQIGQILRNTDGSEKVVPHLSETRPKTGPGRTPGALVEAVLHSSIRRIRISQPEGPETSPDPEFGNLFFKIFKICKKKIENLRLFGSVLIFSNFQNFQNFRILFFS